MIRVAIADDHALVREGLRRMISGVGQIEIVGEAEDGEAAIALVREHEPDVLLLDITMPRKNGIEATAEIAALGVRTKILILSMHNEEQYALRTLRAGATGFIGKDARLEQLVEAIAAVHEGKRFLPHEIRQAFAEKHIQPDAEEPLAEKLSKREFEVMVHLAEGLNNREIAEKLGISVKTVDTHRGHVLKKLNLRNNSDITRFAIQHGYVRY